jgi:sugar lactone lactonase YvrE
MRFWNERRRDDREKMANQAGLLRVSHLDTLCDMRMNSRWSSLLISAIAIFAIAGCGGSSSSGPASGPTVSNYYVADAGNHRIVRFASFAQPTGFISFFLGAQANPTDIAFDSGSNTYATDTVGNQVFKINSDFATGNAPYTGQGNSIPLSAPSGLAVDSLNRIYIADTGNARIVRMDDFSGTNFTQFPAPGSSSKPFVAPYNVRVDSNFNIYVSDMKQNAIYEMSDMAGDNLVSLTHFTSSKPTFNQPMGLDLDFQNNIYVADYGNNRIVRFSNIAGANEVEWYSGGVVGKVAGITVLGRDQILMADGQNSRIYRILDMNGSSPSSYGTPGTGTDQLMNPTAVRAH